MHRPIVASVLAVVCLCSFSTQSEELDKAMLRRGIDATVFIKSERVFRGLYFPGYGTGFFVHPEGYVLTNWHVVADQIVVRIWDDMSEIKTRVLKLEVVVNSGLPDEMTYSAKVVAWDRDRDLALLEVPVQPKAWLPIASPPQVDLGQSIWHVGYPLGMMLSADWEEGSTSVEEFQNPSVSLNRGMVTSIRRDPKGKLKAIQIDAAVNPGNSGGPLFDYEGRVVGVVNSKIMGAEGLGFAISSVRLGEFATVNSARVSFEPKSVIRSSASPLMVTVKPMLAKLDNMTGTARLSGEGIEAVDIALENDGELWSGAIPVPELGPDDPDPEHYFVEIEFTRGESEVAIKRRFRLKSGSAIPTLHSQRDPVKMLEDRKLFSNEIEISDFTNSSSVNKSSTRSLSEAAKDLKLERSEGGSVVIDQNAVNQVRPGHDRRFPPERYQEVEKEAHRDLARRYDISRWTCDDLESKIRSYQPVDPDVLRRRGLYYSERKSKSEYEENKSRLARAKTERRSLTDRMRHARLVFCHDSNQWFNSHNFPCEAPETP